MSGRLLVVSTPIGNLADLSARAREALTGADAVVCEDTRHTGLLLSRLGVRAQRLISCHEHNERQRLPQLLARLEAGETLALASDAGTPLVSDPGFRLVREAREAGIAITTLPGPCAAVAGVTLSGLPNDRFLFAGFLPTKEKARADMLTELSAVPATLVFYETAPRLVKSLEAIAQVLSGREIAVAREVTKLHEECRTGSAEELMAHYEAHPPRGEIVLLVGPPGEPEVSADDADDLLREALTSMKASQAASHVARATGIDRKTLYERALSMRQE